MVRARGDGEFENGLGACLKGRGLCWSLARLGGCGDSNGEHLAIGGEMEELEIGLTGVIAPCLSPSTLLCTSSELKYLYL